MASTTVALIVALVFSMAQLSTSMGSSRRLMELYEPPPSDRLRYHNGGVLSGDIPVSILWYGRFTPAHKSIVSDFLVSLTTAPNGAATPSVGQWWGTIEQLYLSKAAAAGNSATTRVLLGEQLTDEDCSSHGRSLTLDQIDQLAARVEVAKGGIALVLTDEDVAVEGFCSSRCGRHGSSSDGESTHVWVGNAVKQCPGQCAWPFAQPQYGPQGAPLVAPNGDVGVDGMVMVLATMVAGTVTNPHGDGYYQGPKGAGLEACSACPGVYGSGAYPGYAGNLLVDPTTGGSYNANGAGGKKYLLPALYDPATSSCNTLV